MTRRCFHPLGIFSNNVEAEHNWQSQRHFLEREVVTCELFDKEERVLSKNLNKVPEASSFEELNNVSEPK